MATQSLTGCAKLYSEFRCVVDLAVSEHGYRPILGLKRWPAVLNVNDAQTVHTHEYTVMFHLSEAVGPAVSQM